MTSPPTPPPPGSIGNCRTKKYVVTPFAGGGLCDDKGAQ